MRAPLLFLAVLPLALGCTPLADAKTTANLVAEVGDSTAPIIERACVRLYEGIRLEPREERRIVLVEEADVYCHPETGTAIRAHADVVSIHAALVATILAIEAGVSCADEAGRATTCDLSKLQRAALDAVRRVGQATTEVQR